MKICIVSYFFLETTIPLVKQMINKGHEVHLFPVLYANNPDGYVIKYSKESVTYGIHKGFNWENESEGLNAYLSNIPITPVFINGSKSKALYKDITTAWRLTMSIKKEKYDVVHLIGGTFFFYYMYLFMGKSISIHTLHEVTAHEKQTRLFDRLLFNKIGKNGKTKIIVHSEVSHNRLSSYFGWSDNTAKDRSIVIPFGFFDTYKYFEGTTPMNLPKDYILFWGRFTEYKGIDVLLRAFKSVHEKHSDTSLVIAGSGEWKYDDLLSDGVTVINKHLTNDEIVTLNKKARFVVCPYTSASQSGITKTTYIFNKPIIASAVGAFVDEIQEGKNGMLVEPGKVESLSTKMMRLIEEQPLLGEMAEYIHQMQSSNDSVYNWSNIADKTLQFYNK